MSEEGTKDKETLPNCNDQNQLVSLPGHNGPSTSSVKIRKSSNLFSAIVRKAKRRKNKNSSEEIRNLHVSSQNLSCASTLSFGIHVEEEVELSIENYEKKCSQTREFCEEKRVISGTNTSNHSISSSTKRVGNIFNKIAKKKQSSETLKDGDIQTIQNESNQCDLLDDKEVEDLEILNKANKENTIISAFIHFGKSPLNLSLADGLQIIQEIVNSLQESENHIINLLSKYIKDANFQKELMNAISQHNKLQWEAERRSCALANDMWIQHLEIGRTQEKILQGTLNSLVRQNRHLQIDNESLFRKHEKALKKLNVCSEHKPRCQECDSQIESVLRHNEKLQAKLETLYRKIESLEGELQIFQKQNDSMEQQLRNSNFKTQNLKALLHRAKTDYELEQSALNFKLETKEQMLKESLEAGDVVLEDLDSLKRQMKNMQFSLNWSKFKVRGSCLTDLIHLCRSCINELSKELINIHGQTSLKDKDINILRDTNIKLQENLKKSTVELDNVSKRLDENCLAETNRLLNEQKLKMLESEVKSAEEKMEKMKAQYENEKSTMLQTITDYTKYKNEIQEKNCMIEQTKLFMTNVTSENYSLKNEIKILNKLLMETGAGDIVREMENNQEEIEFFRVEFQKMQGDKQHLLAKIETLHNENSILVDSQETSYKSLQRQLTELKALNEENQTLRQKIEREHHTVTSLQNERMKYLDEKNILKSIIQHLKAELSKIRQLEENLTNVTKEASKLGMIAEYNKQQGERLKQEVVERDLVIVQLKNSVQKLNEVQIQNSKDKLSLCYELNEVCQLKAQLSEFFNTEVRKNAELGQSKEAIVKSTNSQIQKIEEKQKNERTAMRILLKDIKIVAEEKENLAKEKDKLLLEIDHLNRNLCDQNSKYADVTTELKKKDERIMDLLKEEELFQKMKKEINEKLEKEMSTYDSNIKHLKKYIEQLRKEKGETENSVQYLKNNIEKLHKDLNVSRQKEKESSDLINKNILKQNKIENALKEKHEEIKVLKEENENLVKERNKLTEDKEKLTNDVNYLNTLMDKVVNDFENSIKSSEQKEEMFKTEFNELKNLVHKYTKEIDELNKMIDTKEIKISELTEICKSEGSYEQKYTTLKEEMLKLEADFNQVKEKKSDIEEKLEDLQEDYESCTNQINKLENDIQVLETQLKIVLEQKEEDYVFYKKHIADLLRTRENSEEHTNKEIIKLKSQLKDATLKIENEKSAYETLSQIHKDVSGKFLKSIKELVDVKNSKQDALEKLKKHEEAITILEDEKSNLQTRTEGILKELEESQHIIINLNKSKSALQKDYATICDKCILLEDKIQKIELDCKKENNDANDKNNNVNASQISILQKDLEENYTIIHNLKMEISEVQQRVNLVELQKSEITLELHETRKKLETEKNLSEQLKNTHKLLLAAVLQMREDGKVDPSDCLHLLHMVRSSSSLIIDAGTANI